MSALKQLTLEKLLLERNQALRSMDLDYARKIVRESDWTPKTPVTDVFLTVMLHKSRYECKAIEDDLRILSGEWLRDRGCGRITGDVILPKGELPE